MSKALVVDRELILHLLSCWDAGLEIDNELEQLRIAAAQPAEAEGVQLGSSRTNRVYLAGPMTGIADYNFPAFNAEADRLRAKGHHVENPADHGVVEGADWADYLRYDIGRLATCERIYLLPGWSKSRGARLEVSIAQALGMHIWYAEGAEDAALAQPAAADGVEATRMTVATITGSLQAVPAVEYDALKAERDKLQAELLVLRANHHATAEQVDVLGYGCTGQIEVLRHVPLTGGMKVSGREREKYNVPLMTVAQHQRILSAVTAERDRLREALRAEQDRYQRDVYGLNNEGDPIGGEPAGGYANDNAKLRAEVEGMRKDAALGSAVQRACCDLPEGFMISVSLEKDAGTLELCLPDTDAVLDDFDGETFAGKIHQAIDAAMAAKEGV